MDIRFCDLCQESVPEADFSNGRASARNGRVICSQCEHAMGGGADKGSAGDPAGAVPRGKGSRPSDAEVAASMRPAPPLVSNPQTTASVAGRGALLLALAAVAVVGFGAPVMLDRIESLEARLDTAAQQAAKARRENRAERAAGLHPVQVAVDDLAAASRQANAGVRAELSARLTQLEETLDQASAASTARGDRLGASLDALNAAVGQLREGLARSRERDQELADVQRVLSFHGDLLVELEERLRSATVVAEAGGSMPGAGAGSPKGAGPVGSNGGPAVEWGQHLEDLESPDPGLRLDAVFALGQTKDLAVAPHVTPMLGDEDVFVRMVSAQVLGALRAKIAVPALIEVLSDDRSAVREAAVVSLRSITGRQFNFDPAGKTQERGRALEAWRTWWRREGDDFLTS